MAASKEEVLANEALDEAMRQEEAKLLEARMPRPSILSGRPGFPPMPPLPPGLDGVAERAAAVEDPARDDAEHRPRGGTAVSVAGDALGRTARQGADGDCGRGTARRRTRIRRMRCRAACGSAWRVLLSGCVKAMRGSVQTYNRTLSLKVCVTLARENVQKSLSGEPDDSDDEANASRTSSPAKTARQEGSQEYRGCCCRGRDSSAGGVGAVNDAGTEATTQAASSQATLAAQPVESMGAASQAESDERLCRQIGRQSSRATSAAPTTCTSPRERRSGIGRQRSTHLPLAHVDRK